MRLAVLLLAALCAAPVSARQAEGLLPREQHPWGQFKIGSWKTVRTTTETLNARGAVVSTCRTDTTTRLIDVDDKGYTLRIDVVVEVAGKRFPAQPQVIRRGFSGEGEGQPISVKRVGRERIEISGRTIACEVREITVDTDEGQRITTVFYSPRLAPHVLRRETTTLDAEGRSTDRHSQVEVIAVDKPAEVKDEVKPTSRLRIVHQQGKASTLTVETHCDDVPGGVVAHTSKETNEAGRVIRQSKLVLLDYGIGNGEDADAQTVRKVFHRARNRRMR